MRIKNSYEYILPVWAVWAIEYNDYAGLTESEENSIRVFLAKIPKNGHFDFSAQEYFSWHNDIDNVGADVITAIYTVFE